MAEESVPGARVAVVGGVDSTDPGPHTAVTFHPFVRTSDRCRGPRPFGLRLGVGADRYPGDEVRRERNSQIEGMPGFPERPLFE